MDFPLTGRNLLPSGRYLPQGRDPMFPIPIGLDWINLSQQKLSLAIDVRRAVQTEIGVAAAKEINRDAGDRIKRIELLRIVYGLDADDHAARQ
jgi:hypothetical protein